jgi:nitrogen fixation protein FixH
MTARETRQGKRSGWQYFPHAMVGAIGLMVLVDGGLAWTAIESFPGRAASNVFDHSNSYDEVLNVAAREAALGWAIRGSVEDGLPVILLTDRDGQGLRGAVLNAVAERPLGAPMTTKLAFNEEQPGRYVGTAALTQPGQWDLRLEARIGEAALHATRRVFVK